MNKNALPVTLNLRRREMAHLPLLLLLTPTAASLRNRGTGKTNSRLRKPTYWWPTWNERGDPYCARSSTYPDAFLENDLLLYKSEDECCSIHSCDDITSTSTTEEPVTMAAVAGNDSSHQLATTTDATQYFTTPKAATQAAESTGQSNSSSSTNASHSDCSGSKWHISTATGGARTCTNDSDYPAVWEGTEYLSDSASACCDFFFDFSDRCIIDDICEHDNEIVGTDCPEMKWHISVISGGANTCTNDRVYPAEWEDREANLFASPKECCDRYFPSDCKVVDHCGCSQNWHMSTRVGERNTCTNDENYPAGWLSRPSRHFFMTPEECCRENFGNEACNVKNTCLKCIETWHVNPEQPGSSW